MVQVSVESLRTAADKLNGLAGEVSSLPRLHSDWAQQSVGITAGDALADAGTAASQALGIVSRRLEAISRLLHRSADSYAGTDIANSANLADIVARQLATLPDPEGEDGTVTFT